MVQGGKNGGVKRLREVKEPAHPDESNHQLTRMDRLDGKSSPVVTSSRLTDQSVTPFRRPDQLHQP